MRPEACKLRLNRTLMGVFAVGAFTTVTTFAMSSGGGRTTRGKRIAAYSSVAVYAGVTFIEFLQDRHLVLGSGYADGSAMLTDSRGKVLAGSGTVRGHVKNVVVEAECGASLCITDLDGGANRQRLLFSAGRGLRSVARDFGDGGKPGSNTRLAGPSISRGSRFVTVGSGTALVMLAGRDLHTMHVFSGFDCDVCDTAISPDGKYVAAVAIAGDAGVEMLRVWRSSTGECLLNRATDDAHAGSDLISETLIFIAKDKLMCGGLLVSLYGRHPSVRTIFNRASWTPILVERCPPAVALCTDSASSKFVALFDVQSGRRLTPIMRLSGAMLDESMQNPFSPMIAISPDGVLAVESQESDKVLLFQLPKEYVSVLKNSRSTSSRQGWRRGRQKGE